ncbi:hypothetical protein ABVN80_06915 [Acinetobacter baumannii]
MCCRRAGADGIWTYFCRNRCRKTQGNELSSQRKDNTACILQSLARA